MISKMLNVAQLRPTLYRKLQVEIAALIVIAQNWANLQLETGNDATLTLSHCCVNSSC